MYDVRSVEMFGCDWAADFSKQCFPYRDLETGCRNPARSRAWVRRDRSLRNVGWWTTDADRSAQGPGRYIWATRALIFPARTMLSSRTGAGRARSLGSRRTDRFLPARTLTLPTPW